MDPTKGDAVLVLPYSPSQPTRPVVSKLRRRILHALPLLLLAGCITLVLRLRTTTLSPVSISSWLTGPR